MPSVPILPMASSDEARFWSKVDKRGPDHCWPWLGHKNHKGYGRFQIGRRPFVASQIAWSLATGEQFPDGKLACHSCDNPDCVNPAHIWPGTHAENMADMLSKGRRGKRTKLQRRKRVRPAFPICGHDLGDTYINGKGLRCCRACRREWDRRSYYRRKQTEAA